MMDRLITPDGVLIAGDLDELDARTRHAALRAEGRPHLWQRYGGERTGWNSVLAWPITTTPNTKAENNDEETAT